MVVGASYGLLWVRSYREGVLDAARLRAQLSAAHLEVMKMQLQPHVLFGALEAIRASIRVDRAGAVSMNTGLGDMLRHALERTGAHEVPLREEVDALEHYLDIKRRYHGERLHVAWSVAPDTKDALVPHLLLQPLAESLLRGEPDRGADTTVEIASRKEDRVLRLSVRVEAAGRELDPEAAGGNPLQTTRARLERLYEQAQSVEVAGTETGGLCITLRIPFRFATGAEEDGRE